MIIKKAIYDNQMGFEPILDVQNPEDSLCNETWRVVQGACWVSYINHLFPDGGRLVYSPCDSVECCSIGLKVCRYSGPPEYISIDTLGGSNMGNCIGITQAIFDPLGLITPIYHADGSVSYNTTTILPCQSRCNWLYGLSDSQYNNSEYYGKDAIFELIPDSSKNRNVILMKLIDKVDYIDCLIYSPINSDNSTITVYNMLGVSMENIKINIKKGINSYKFKTLNYYPGLYIIQLTIDGTKKISDKFIIIR